MALAMREGPERVEVWERRPGAALQPARRYRRREPERTLLHAVVREHLEPFLAAARNRSTTGRGLPAHVERDLRAYVGCGILANGFARIRCPDCGYERLVAFSCKARSCPSCNARRMEDAAEHLVRNVFPTVPVRQWVLSLPRNLRFLAAREPKVASRLLEIFTRTLSAWQRRAARRTGVADPRTAGVTAVQRFGGAINLNVHFHTLVPDGVFDLSGDGTARFVPLPAPSDEEVERILEAVVRKVERRLGRLDIDLAPDDDAFAALQAQEAGRRPRFPDPFRHTRRSALLDGFSLHAGTSVHANDREGLERLSRYAMRPPLALDRLSAGEEGRLVYRMKRPRGGALFLLLTPDELLARIATLVPPPRTHALRYHGLFAPNAKGRGRVVPGGERRKARRCARERAVDPANIDPAPPTGAATEGEPFRLAPPPSTSVGRPEADDPGAGEEARYRVPWAELLRKVFAIDVLECPRCAGRLELIAFIADGGVARRILAHLGLATHPPPLAKALAADDELPADPGPAYDVADPVYED